MDEKFETSRPAFRSGDTTGGSFAEWHIEIMEDFWSGRWNDNDAAFVFLAVAFGLMFSIPLFWNDIVFYLGFAWDLIRQPVYGGALFFFLWRVRRRRLRAALQSNAVGTE